MFRGRYFPTIAWRPISLPTAMQIATILGIDANDSDGCSMPGRCLPDPEPRQRWLQPATGPHRRDLERQPGRIVGLDRDAAQRGHSLGRLEPSRWNGWREPPERFSPL